MERKVTRSQLKRMVYESAMDVIGKMGRMDEMESVHASRALNNTPPIGKPDFGNVYSTLLDLKGASERNGDGSMARKVDGMISKLTEIYDFIMKKREQAESLRREKNSAEFYEMSEIIDALQDGFGFEPGMSGSGANYPVQFEAADFVEVMGRDDYRRLKSMLSPAAGKYADYIRSFRDGQEK